MTKARPWWETDHYDDATPVPESLVERAGPQGLALVKAWPSGLTDRGWGLEGPNGEEGFMPRYLRREFNQRRVLYGFERGKWNFAIVMRSVKALCIDIDGKNDGLEHAKKLMPLPPTLAETSKSGNGYHLFYEVDDTWNSDTGFSLLNDRIGIEIGVDVRATGCVYHYPQQLWNQRPLAMLPNHLYDQLRHRDLKVQQSNNRIEEVLASQDTMEILMMQTQFETDLAKPIPAGRRNNTLFAIGTQMAKAQVPDWQDKVHDRAVDVGLSVEEADKLVSNIDRYKDSAP